MNKCSIFPIASAVILAGAAVLATNESGGIQFLRECVCLRVSARKLKEPPEVQDLRRRAIQGDAQAQFELGNLYEKGKDVREGEDHAKKSEWWLRAAEQGHVGAQCALGHLCQSVPDDDYAEAAKWFCRAAWRGCAEAQVKLALLYAQGQGVPQDEREAYIWHAVSVMGGDSGDWNFLDALAKGWPTAERNEAHTEAERRRAKIRRRQNSSAD